MWIIWYIIKHLTNPYLLAIFDKGIENVVEPRELKVTNNYALLYSILKSSIITGKHIDNDYKSSIIIDIPSIYNGIIKGYFVFFIFNKCFDFYYYYYAYYYISDSNGSS